MALAQFDDDPFDPDPALRGLMMREAVERAGIAFLHIDRPALPTGHMGRFEPAFDLLFGAALARFAIEGR